MYDKNYEMLADAIIVQAAKDYPVLNGLDVYGYLIYLMPTE